MGLLLVKVAEQEEEEEPATTADGIVEATRSSEQMKECCYGVLVKAMSKSFWVMCWSE